MPNSRVKRLRQKRKSRTPLVHSKVVTVTDDEMRNMRDVRNGLNGSRNAVSDGMGGMSRKKERLLRSKMSSLAERANGNNGVIDRATFLMGQTRQNDMLSARLQEMQKKIDDGRVQATMRNELSAKEDQYRKDKLALKKQIAEHAHEEKMRQIEADSERLKHEKIGRAHV